ncbi:MAG TPA: ABC transporter ATP-binding protein [Euzebya sp.]|nr:ABC transporter ATP-binding protein [Euzebya sp.]
MTAVTDRLRSTTPALQARGVRIEGLRDGRLTPITDPFDLHVMPGEAIAVVGESGSGKSLAMRALLDLLPPGVRSSGSVSIAGADLTAVTGRARRRARGRQIAFVMQDPFTMLNPVQRCGRQVTAALTDERGRPLSRARRAEEARRRLAEVGITDPHVADRYPFELSGGMQQRVAIAAAIAENPAVLIADEPTTALDVTTQRDVLALLDQLRRTHHLSLILVTHDLRVATSVCDRIYVMYAGSIVETAPAGTFLTDARHPYSRALLDADPPLDRRLDRLPSIAGSVPAPGARPEWCRFEPRCPIAVDECRDAVPALLAVEGTHRVRCIRAMEQVQTRPAVPAKAMQDPAPSPTAPPLIELQGVTRRFGHTTAVQEVDLEVHAGECLGLVGESGSGKTTIGRMMVGLTAPSEGHVRVAGVDLSGRVSRDGWSTVRSTVQMAFQNPSSTLNLHRTVGATLRDALRLVDRHDLHQRTDELLAMVGLGAEFGHRRPAQLSGGERQRVGIARALARNPRIVVCDEVVSALDVSVQAHILNLLTELRERLAIGYVFISHDLAVVRQMAERVCVLKDGVVVEQGPTEQVLGDPQHPYTRRLIDSIPQGGSPR